MRPKKYTYIFSAYVNFEWSDEELVFELKRTCVDTGVPGMEVHRVEPVPPPTPLRLDKGEETGGRDRCNVQGVVGALRKKTKYGG